MVLHLSVVIQTTLIKTNSQPTNIDDEYGDLKSVIVEKYLFFGYLKMKNFFNLNHSGEH